MKKVLMVVVGVLALNLVTRTEAGKFFAQTAQGVENKEEKNGEEGDEQTVALADCPEAVQKTIKAQAGEGKINKIEKKTEAGKVIYEAELLIDGKQRDIEVAADGTVLKSEAGNESDNQDDKDEGK